ncbi:glycine cleavage system aminomethyltransferase GcvT [Vannielia litorea]|uniref:glycine cleavage system aminomethyltransferase GcvT n=1 Tax=Vannielia litorea TaxID=1217970 RepID=UPI001BD19D5A|nr:glycine cleavage system aminomethyltransferase GcvT [Vannielia litorea]MBS8229056.1 glycine cleavage system aminomethyltransferase GcvT [Vannielia litorea]
MTDLKRTPLYALNEELGGKMVPFAGWEMPVQFAPGVMKEHLHTRAACGLFDVSHMGQVVLRGAGAAEALEALVPVDLIGLKPGRQRYALFTNDAGGILDDLMVANYGDRLLIVVNAANAEADIAHMRRAGLEIEPLEDRALIALQGPAAEAVLEAVTGAVPGKFMDVAEVESSHGDLWISRSGYTGEDGFEVSVPARHAEEFARKLLAHEACEPIGLGARDSLRLEAGLPLHGHDIDETTTPVEAALTFALSQARRAGGVRAGGYPGASVIEEQLAGGPARLRTGLLPEGRAPMREGVPLFASEDAAEPVGTITSGAYSPSLERPIAMGYVPTEAADPGTGLYAELRGKRLPLVTAPMPFQPSTYKR